MVCPGTGGLVGTGACPVTLPVGRFVYTLVGPGVGVLKGLGVSIHWGTSQHVGSFGSGMRLQPWKMPWKGI